MEQHNLNTADWSQ